MISGAAAVLGHFLVYIWKRCSWPAAHTASAADGWRLGVRTEEVRERVGERY